MYSHSIAARKNNPSGQVTPPHSKCRHIHSATARPDRRRKPQSHLDHPGPTPQRLRAECPGPDVPGQGANVCTCFESLRSRNRGSHRLARMCSVVDRALGPGLMLDNHAPEFGIRGTLCHPPRTQSRKCPAIPPDLNSTATPDCRPERGSKSLWLTLRIRTFRNGNRRWIPRNGDPRAPKPLRLWQSTHIRSRDILLIKSGIRAALPCASHPATRLDVAFTGW